MAELSFLPSTGLQVVIVEGGQTILATRLQVVITNKELGQQGYRWSLSKLQECRELRTRSFLFHRSPGPRQSARAWRKMVLLSISRTCMSRRKRTFAWRPRQSRWMWTTALRTSAGTAGWRGGVRSIVTTRQSENGLRILHRGRGQECAPAPFYG